MTQTYSAEPHQIRGGRSAAERSRSNERPKSYLASRHPSHRGVAQLAAVVQRVTKVRNQTAAYDYGAGHTEPVGSVGEAWLDPDDPKKGSAPGDGEIAHVMGAFRDKGYKSMIRGHLMNGQLGGPGIASNLFPITSRANSWHKSYAENHIKHAVTGGQGVYYRVNVDSAFNIKSPNATFECYACEWDPKKNKTNPKKEILKLGVKSEPEKKTTGSAKLIDLDTNKEASFLKKVGWSFYDWAPNTRSFATAKLAKGWGEHGHGYSAGRISDQGHYKEDGNLV